MSKEFYIEPHPKQPTVYRVQIEGGGNLPDALKGHHYTRRQFAQEAIDAHLATRKTVKAEKPKKGKKNGTATTK